jgi:FixJ family two-component response regulator
MPGQPRVLVVDDDPGICHLLHSFLAVRGYHPLTVANAEDALERYRVDRPAAVILDVTLPGPMDGLEALAAFRKIDRDVPVIMLSGQGRTPTVVQAIKLGASDFVGKPFDDAKLEASIGSAVAQRQPLRVRRYANNSVAGLHPMLIGESGENDARYMSVSPTRMSHLIPEKRYGQGVCRGRRLVARRDKPFVRESAVMPADRPARSCSAEHDADGASSQGRQVDFANRTLLRMRLAASHSPGQATILRRASFTHRQRWLSIRLGIDRCPECMVEGRFGEDGVSMSHRSFLRERSKRFTAD